MCRSGTVWPPLLLELAFAYTDYVSSSSNATVMWRSGIVRGLLLGQLTFLDADYVS